MPTGKEMLEALLYFGSFLQDLYDTRGEKSFVLGKSEVEEGDTDSKDKSNDEVDLEDWVIIEDIIEEEALAAENDVFKDAQWELRRRRKR